MNQIKNISLKFGRIETISKIKRELDCGMETARDFVDKALSYALLILMK